MNQGRGIAFTSKVETMKEEEIKNSKKENSFRGRGWGTTFQMKSDSRGVDGLTQPNYCITRGTKQHKTYKFQHRGDVQEISEPITTLTYKQS